MPAPVKRSILATTLAAKAGGRKFITERLTTPAWLGPVEAGITQSMLGGYFADPERFRLSTVEGLCAISGFIPAIEYGHLWHTADEHFAAGKDWLKPLTTQARQLCVDYPFEQKEILKWFNVCKTQFPIYIEHWKDQDDVRRRIPVFQELNFKLPYKLPSGRIVLLRGKADGVDYLLNDGIYLVEHKTKANIDEYSLLKQLTFDLQLNFYLVVVRELLKSKPDWLPKYSKAVPPNAPIRGVRYNVVRRPLSGGPGSIKQKKATKKQEAETDSAFYERLGGIIRESPDQFFFRWKVKLQDADLNLFQHTCLDPVLENLLDDYEWWSFALVKHKDVFDYRLRQKQFPAHQRRHYRTPFGLWNNLLEGRVGDLDGYLETGSMVGLERRDEFFPELQ